MDKQEDRVREITKTSGASKASGVIEIPRAYTITESSCASGSEAGGNYTTFVVVENEWENDKRARQNSAISFGDYAPNMSPEKDASFFFEGADKCIVNLTGVLFEPQSGSKYIAFRLYPNNPMYDLFMNKIMKKHTKLEIDTPEEDLEYSFIDKRNKGEKARSLSIVKDGGTLVFKMPIAKNTVVAEHPNKNVQWDEEKDGYVAANKDRFVASVVEFNLSELASKYGDDNLKNLQATMFGHADSIFKAITRAEAEKVAQADILAYFEVGGKASSVNFASQTPSNNGILVTTTTTNVASNASSLSDTTSAEATDYKSKASISATAEPKDRNL